jgi:hypothetical protein
MVVARLLEKIAIERLAKTSDIYKNLSHEDRIWFYRNGGRVGKQILENNTTEKMIQRKMMISGRS